MFYSIKTYLRSEGWKGRGLYVAQRGPVPTLFGQGNHSNSARAIFACWPRLFVMLTRRSLMRVPFWMVRTVDCGFAGESPLPIVPAASALPRSEEHRVGKEGVGTSSSCWSPDH